MGSTFYGFEISKKGLFFNQKALDVTAHNVANADTKGYTRQRIIGSSIEPSANLSTLAQMFKGSVGAGVDIQSIDRIRNTFLDRQYRNENSSIGEWEIKTDALSYMEDIFKEPSDTGISNALNEFFSGLEELSKNVGSKDIRTSLVQQALSMTETINYSATQLQQVQQDQDFAIVQSVEQVNDIIRNIASLNEQIARFELGGQPANDLRDKRDLFIDNLSEYMDISYKEETVNGQNILKINANIVDNTGATKEITIVDNDTFFSLGTYKKTNNGNADPFHSIYIQSNEPGADNINGVSAIEVSQFTTGKLRGYMDMRDGNTVNNKGAQYFINQLDDFAESLVSEINTVHKSGWTYPDMDAGLPSQTGINFFDENCTKASNIKLDANILANVYNIAGSSEEVDGIQNTGNNKTILDLLELRDNKSITGSYNFEEFLRSFSTELGVETSYANNMYSNRGYLLSNIDTKRQSVSGVSVDEEMANMVRYEKSYQASARMITAMDEMLDILINKTGLVGR